MKTEIYLKSGFLSVYGFSCGYLESTEIHTQHGATQKVEIYKESGTYHVRFIDRTKKSNNGNYIHIWDCFYSLSEAKKHYFDLIKLAKNDINLADKQ
jgi:hypothetical protein